MRFDPITGIWAANKAAEIVGGSGGSGCGLPVVDMSDSIIYDDEATTINITAEQAARINGITSPVFVWCDFFGGLKVCVLLTPNMEEDYIASYAGVAQIEGVLFAVTVYVSDDGGSAIITQIGT